MTVEDQTTKLLKVWSVQNGLGHLNLILDSLVSGEGRWRI